MTDPCRTPFFCPSKVMWDLRSEVWNPDSDQDAVGVIDSDCLAFPDTYPQFGMMLLKGGTHGFGTRFFGLN